MTWKAKEQDLYAASSSLSLPSGSRKQWRTNIIEILKLLTHVSSLLHVLTLISKCFSDLLDLLDIVSLVLGPFLSCRKGKSIYITSVRRYFKRRPFRNYFQNFMSLQYFLGLCLHAGFRTYQSSWIKILFFRLEKYWEREKDAQKSWSELLPIKVLSLKLLRNFAHEATDWSFQSSNISSACQCSTRNLQHRAHPLSVYLLFFH